MRLWIGVEYGRLNGSMGYMVRTARIVCELCCAQNGHSFLQFRQRLHFRRVITAEVAWYMAFIVWLGMEQGAVGGTGS